MRTKKLICRVLAAVISLALLSASGFSQNKSNYNPLSIILLLTRPGYFILPGNIIATVVPPRARNGTVKVKSFDLWELASINLY
jgi:hypothetical protein